AAEPRLARQLEAALLAPAHSALPDLTFPARKDSRYGVSLAQPMHLELWEVGRAALMPGPEPTRADAVARWLQALYAAPAVTPELFDSYLHDAPLAWPPVPLPPSRRTLSWWALLFMPPDPPPAADPWRATSVLLEAQGLAVLRVAGRYASLECGPVGGGHGHPDRLHLTLHAEGVPWLADPGTGSYLARELLWYRSTLAHNAPQLDGASQPRGDATCEMFDVQGDWAWVRGRYGEVTRCVVVGPEYVLDAVELASRTEHLIELPWHFRGTGTVCEAGPASGGRWTAGELAHAFVSRAERFIPAGPGPTVLEFTVGSQKLRAILVFDGELLRAEGPGLPGSGEREPFYLVRARGRGAHVVSVLAPGGTAAKVRGLAVRGGVIEVTTAEEPHVHTATAAGWEVATASGRVRLGGARAPELPAAPLLELDRPRPTAGAALRVSDPPLLDGSLDGFDLSEPLELALEDQYRRSEEPYAGPEDFSAVAYVAWDDAALYLAVSVTKPELCFRPPGAAPLQLGNEPDDIHSDGLQLYLRDPERAGAVGFLVVPEGQAGGALRVSGAGDTPGAPATVRGAWRRTQSGYAVTLAVPWPAGLRPHVGAQVGFDLIINEMLPERLRRVGQLVWSGGNGWVWLRSDRQDPERMGILELVG
ncbi:MAG TPA: heparinase II/III family protein, partial [Gemmatimonadales bacterium]|nr:heparinase II/III family protein [Gemmatimonadales bacterium]